MYDMGRAFYLAADMVARLDPEMIGIVLLSFRVSLAAFLLGLPLGGFAM